MAGNPPRPSPWARANHSASRGKRVRQALWPFSLVRSCGRLYRHRTERFRCPRQNPCLTLALQGGGSLGAFTWGVLDCLLDRPELARISHSVVAKWPEGDGAGERALADLMLR